MASDTRVFTIRIPSDVADEIDLIARVEGNPVSVVIREALAALVAARRADLEFRSRLKRRIEADREILQRLATQEVSGQ
jgi:predicted transcriptional regulator